MASENPTDVRDMTPAQYAAHKAKALQDLLRQAPRYQENARPVPLPADPNGAPKAVSDLTRSEYEIAKAALRRTLSGFGAMATTPGLDTPKR
jgi:hypothetical protein